MSDRKEEISAAETAAIEQALGQAMATGQEPRPVSSVPLRGNLPFVHLQAGEGADSGMVREYTELLGLLPYGLAAEAPPAHLEETIMRRLPGARPSEAPAAGRADDSVTPFPQPASPARTPWVQVAMAAMPGVCLLGLGFMGALVWKQNQQIGLLHGQLAAVAPAPAQTGGALEVEVATLRQRLDMITNVARQAYPMRRVSRAEASGQPEGIIYVCGNHQRWYLSLHGLEPPSPGEEYHLWFMTEDGKVDGGTLDVRPDTSSEREATSMPDGTQGFVVTLERPREQDPESLTILLGEKPVNL